MRNYDNNQNRPPHYHILTVKYLGPTNSRGSRVKISSDRFEQSKTIPYDHSLNCARDIAIAWLQENGFEVTGTAEGKSIDYVISSTFKRLQEGRFFIPRSKEFEESK